MKRMWLWLLMVLLCVDAQAAQQQVSGGTGVTWGQERAKVNANFTELYSMYTDAEIDGLLGLKQGADADLNIYAGITPSANVQSLLGAANYGAIRGLLDLEAGTDFNAYDADLTSASGASAAGASKYWGTNASSVAGFYDLPAGGTGLTSMPTLDNQIIQATGADAYAWTDRIDGLIDDTATNGDSDKLWSADKIYDTIMLNKGVSTLATLSDWPVGLTPSKLGYVGNVTSDIQAQIAAINVGSPVTNIPASKDAVCIKGQYAYSADGLTRYDCVSTNSWRTSTLVDSMQIAETYYTLSVTPPANGNAITCADSNLVTNINCGNGSAVCSSQVVAGNEITGITAVAASGYTFSNWAGDLSGSESPTTVTNTITMNASKDISASFIPTSGDCGNLGTWGLYYDADHTDSIYTACIQGSTTTVSVVTGVVVDTAFNSTSGGQYGVTWDGTINSYLTVPATGITPTNGRLEFNIKTPSVLPTSLATLGVVEWSNGSQAVIGYLQYSAGQYGFRVKHADGTTAYSSLVLATLAPDTVYKAIIDWNGSTGELYTKLGGTESLATGLTLSGFTVPTGGVNFGERSINDAAGDVNWYFDDIYLGASRR